MEKISVIMPVYNAENFLKRCLDSIINQTYKNIEIICVNDGSKDNSLNILKEYQKKDDRIVIIDKINAGVSAARNDAIKKSTGEYITFVDADDWIELNGIELLYKAIKEQNVDVVRGNFYINYDEKTNGIIGDLGSLKNEKYFSNQEKYEKLINNFLNGSIQCYVCLLMIKKEYINKTSFFREEISYMEDVIFYIELLLNINSIYFLDKPFYHYYSNPNSASKSKDYFIRNIYNVIKVDNYILQILKNSKYNYELKYEIKKAASVKTILGYLYAMYINFENKEELKKEINKILNDKSIYNLLETSDLNLLSQNIKKYIEKIILKIILKRKYNLLFIIYKLRSILERR